MRPEPPAAVISRPAEGPMTREEARACAGRVRSSLEGARVALLELYEREGWRALGYDSWRACAEAEFSLSRSRVWQLLAAARLERELADAGPDPPPGPVPERALRPLAGLDPETRREVWADAVDAAGDAVPSGPDVEELARLAREAALALGEAGRGRLAEAEARAASREEAAARTRSLARLRRLLDEVRRLARSLALEEAAREIDRLLGSLPGPPAPPGVQ